jgi:hypothetical protein
MIMIYDVIEREQSRNFQPRANSNTNMTASKYMVLKYYVLSDISKISIFNKVIVRNKNIL